MKCVVGEKELCYTFRQEASCYKVDTLPDLQKKGGDADGTEVDPVHRVHHLGLGPDDLHVPKSMLAARRPPDG